VAASTHDGEEQLVLAAHAELLRTSPDALLILVPRHPQRFAAAARLIDKAQLAYARRSAMPAGVAAAVQGAQVLLGDSMGEMFVYMAASDVAFVGGSLADVGGHNVLEPASLGLPVLFGPYMHNFVAARQLLLDVQGAIEVNEASLADTVRVLLGSPARRQQLGEAGRAAVEANRGALQRLLKLLETPV